MSADYYYIALRGASIKRSQRGNSEAIFGEMGGNSTHSLSSENSYIIVLEFLNLERHLFGEIN